MNLLEHNTKECEVLKTIPPEKRMEFIEKNGQRLSDILDFEEERAKEEMEALTEGYRGI